MPQASLQTGLQAGPRSGGIPKMTIQSGLATAVFVTPYGDEFGTLQPVLEAPHCTLALAKAPTQALPLLNAPPCGIIQAQGAVVSLKHGLQGFKFVAIGGHKNGGRQTALYGHFGDSAA